MQKCQFNNCNIRTQPRRDDDEQQQQPPAAAAASSSSSRQQQQQPPAAYEDVSLQVHNRMQRKKAGMPVVSMKHIVQAHCAKHMVQREEQCPCDKIYLQSDQIPCSLHLFPDGAPFASAQLFVLRVLLC